MQGGSWYWASGDYQSGDPGGYIYTRLVSTPYPDTDLGTQIVSVDQGTHGAIVEMTTTSDAIYWCTSAASYGIRTTPLTGGTPTDVPGGAISTVQVEANTTFIPVGNTLYFNRNVDTSSLDGIYKYTPGDATPTELVVAEDVVSFIVDADSIYFVQQNVNGVWKAPIAGGTATQIATQDGQHLVGVDATSVYLADSGCCQTTLYHGVK
jgi:hypothetical protein